LDSLHAKIYVLKLRPSSHSDDYTIIATYRDKRAARKVGDALERLLGDMKQHTDEYDTDWSPEEASVQVVGERVWFEVYTAGYMDDVESVLRKVAVPKEVECYRNHQELKVRVNVPIGLNMETAALILDKDEAQALKWFREVCGEPKVEDCGDGAHQILEWSYEGDEIYCDDTLYLGFEFSLEGRDNWTIELC
jgi:hypothetical protein